MKKHLLLSGLVLLCALPFLSAQTTLVPYGAPWRYLDNGKDPGTAWRKPAFDDRSWKSGPSQLGYGDKDEATVVSYGSSSKKKYITTYFRKAISVPDVSAISGYALNLIRDDGAVVYINGREVYRTNMPSGTISYRTKASSDASRDGNKPQTRSLPAGTLVAGTNVIAVEIHQSSSSSSDISFDLELKATSSGTTAPPAPTPPPAGSDNARLTRGPYLQMGNETAMSLRWRTDVATDSKIEVGTSEGAYTLSATNPVKTIEHEVRITGLRPGTRYFYRFGSSAKILQSGSSNFFHTAPPATTTRRIRIAAFGDCGKNSNGHQTGALNSYQHYAGANPAELMLLLGDNAYPDGTDAQYQASFFNAYSPTVLKNHVLFPAPGNHDYHTTTKEARTAPYFNNFSLPTAGECGGVPSGTKAYYSFNWGNIHFISLDSYGTESSKRMADTTGAQTTWLKKDLEANTREWVVVFFHHPPYTKGSHDSDDESELVNIRKNFIRILERYGVDLVVAGHSHDYERSYLLNNHYGKESSFSPASHTKSTSSAKYDGSSNSCPYVTPSGKKSNKGTVYVVSGSAGNSGDLASGWPHNALPFAFNDGGMLYLEVEGNRLDGKFLRMDKTVADRFTLLHDVNLAKTVSVPAGGSAQLSASWTGDYRWSTGAATRSITVRAGNPGTYKVTDGKGCLTDVFQVTVANAASAARPEAGETPAGPAVKVFPTLARRGQPITLQGPPDEVTQLDLLDDQVRMLRSVQFTGNASLETGNLPAGTYFLQVKGGANVPAQKIAIVE